MLGFFIAAYSFQRQNLRGVGGGWGVGETDTIIITRFLSSLMSDQLYIMTSVKIFCYLSQYLFSGTSVHLLRLAASLYIAVKCDHEEQI